MCNDAIWHQGGRKGYEEIIKKNEQKDIFFENKCYHVCMDETIFDFTLLSIFTSGKILC